VRKQKELPFRCPDCLERFGSKGAMMMHQKDKHRITVHSFADLAAHRKPPTGFVGFGGAAVAILASLVSAALYGFLIGAFARPELGSAVVSAIATAAGFFTGLAVIWSLRPRKRANKENANGQKKAA
jgi:hypothetical protein